MDILNGMKEAFALGKNSIVQFRQVFHPSKGEVAPAPFHYDWDRILRLERRHFAIEAFRESAKSQYVCREFPLYCLVYPSYDNNYIVFILSTQTKAGNKIKEISDEYLNDPVLSANLVKVYEDSQKAFEVAVTDEDGNIIRVRFEGYGKGSAVRGLSNRDQRPKLVIIDDPQDTEDALSENGFEKDWDWFLSDVKFLGQTTRIFLIGNNLGEKCLIERIAKDAEILGFTFVRLPIIQEIDDERVISWPSKYVIEDIEKERDTYTTLGKLDIWYRERMCIALSPESQLFKKEDFRYYDADKLKRKGLSVYVTVDLAISQKKSADYTAICAVGVNSDNHWFVLDFDYGRYDPDKTMDALFRMVQKWRPIKVGIEKVAYQASFEFYVNKEMQARNIWFRTFGLKADNKKVERIAAIQPRFKTGTVWFARDAKWLNELQSELLSFTMEGSKGLHDDLIDALAYIAQIALPPIKSNDVDDMPLAGAM